MRVQAPSHPPTANFTAGHAPAERQTLAPRARCRRDVWRGRGILRSVVCVIARLHGTSAQRMPGVARPASHADAPPPSAAHGGCRAFRASSVI
jgi:hypothetical protein